jgi:hypothetical protein
MMNPPEEHCKGKVPDSWTKAFMEALCCVGCLIGVTVLSLFVCLCVVLAATNNEIVKHSCSGFWEFMVIALLSPILIPLIYVVCCSSNWNIFSGVCCFVFGIVSLHMSISMGENERCVEALRMSTPPIPWLLYAVWLKTVLFFLQCVYGIQEEWKGLKVNALHV